jgi:prepilin-type processing-associated H-X9-DG protein
MPANRRGLTLVELLVIIAIIALLIAMLLPAVQGVREASRRTLCLNNMKQVALSLQQFHQANGRLPNGAQNNPTIVAGYKTDGTDDHRLPIRMIGSWQLVTLPHVDNAALYDRFVLTANLGNVTNRELIKIPLPSFICPSDPGSSKPVRTMCGGGHFGNRPEGGWVPSEQMAVWYAPNYGPSPPHRCNGWRNCSGCYRRTAMHSASNPNYCCYSRPSPASVWPCIGFGGTGVGMFQNSFQPVTFDSVLDGLSNTMLVCETLPDATMHNGFYGGGNSVVANIPINRFPSAFDIADIEAAAGVCATDTPPSPLPSGRFAGLNSLNTYIDSQLGGIKSRHPGGAMAAFCDGSVRYLEEFTDVYVVAALGSRNLGVLGVEEINLP